MIEDTFWINRAREFNGVKICLFLKFEGRPGNEKRSKQCYQEVEVDNSLPES